MQLPPGITEQQFLAATTKVVNLLAHSFTFGYLDKDDIKQQATVFAIEAMSRYDPSRPLDNFLYTHVRNRLINFRRDKFRRNDPPCLSCYNSIEGETQHADKQYCQPYRTWLKRNAAKQNVMNPLDLSNINDENEVNTKIESDIVADVAQAELLAMIDVKLDVQLRPVYLQMQAGESVPKAKREAVEQAVLKIIRDNAECLENVED